MVEWPRMLVEGRIETINFQKIFPLQITFGLDTAGKHRLLDQRITFETISINARSSQINSRGCHCEEGDFPDEAIS